MLDRIIELLSKHTNYDKTNMNRDTSLVRDLDLNSIEVMQMMLEFEEEFEIEFDEEKILGITTIGDLEDCIRELSE